MAGVSLVRVWIKLCVIVVLFTVASSVAQSNILYQVNATGSAVVLQAIGRLQQSGVFGNDNELLRRIAYVEARDGTLTNASTDGGIWAVRESKFLQTQDLEANIQLPAILTQIQNIFGIDWMSVQWRDLRMPLYSMIAARLVLYLTPQAIPPSNDLEAQVMFWVQYYNPDGDEDDFIGVSRALQGSSLDSSANEFFLGFSLNYDGRNSLLQLIVTTTESSPVKFIVNATGFSYSGKATRNPSTNVTLPNSLQVRTVSERNKGIYVKAEGDRKITVYGLNYERSTSDAFLALPCNHLPIDEYEYLILTYSSAYMEHLSGILIVACEDNTVVNNGQSTFVILNRLQTYLIRNTTDLTGRRITANKPIALFSNHECTNVPTEIGACDHLTEQIPPTSTWGQFFLAASLLGRRSGEVFRIVAAQPPTTAIVNCTNFTQPVSYLLTAATNWQEFEILPDSFCSITSTTPILVAQFAKGSVSDRVGDPFMMIIPPMEQYNTNNYAFNSLPMFQLNYITVYVEPEYFQPDRIFIDGFNLTNSQWSQIRDHSTICGYITRVNLTTAGDHWLYHLDQYARIGVSVYGFIKDNSYGYPGGMKLTPLQLAIVSFSSATYLYNEEIGGAQITITRSRNRETAAVVLVASNNIQITTCEGSMPASPVLEFQPGETKKQITITFSNTTRIEMYLSAGEGVYLTPFPRTEIMNPDDTSGCQNSEACMCHGLNCSCQCSTVLFPTTYPTTLFPTTALTTSFKDSNTSTSRSVCIWCITLITTGAAGAAMFTVVGVIIVILMVIKCVFKTNKQSSDETNVEMQTCEAYETIQFSNLRVTMEENPAYGEVGAIRNN